MRKYVILAVVALASMVMASFASADDIQSIDAKVTPTKLDKKKYKPAKLLIDIKTKNNSGAATNSDQPPSADRTVVDFAKNLKITTKAAPNCAGSEAQLQNTTTDQAKDICGKKSIVSVASGTSAHVTVDSNPALPNSASLPVPVVVTAFNGTAKNTLYLHARAESVNTTSVLVGKLKKGSSPYGYSLDVTIPPLLAGAIDDFKVTVKAGKYIQARCKSKKNPFQATTFFENWSGGPKASDTTQTKCKQKKGKKKGHK